MALIRLANNTTTTAEGYALDARQGKILMDAITEATANYLPTYTYSGNAQLLDDGKVNGVQNWRIKFFTSGTIKFTKNPGSVDVFVVGGGGGGGNSVGGGGGGGYTKTQRGVSLTKNTNYTVTIGAGGTRANNGGDSSAFGVTATGGKGSTSKVGGAGGSGGGGGAPNDDYNSTGTGGYGGTNGGNGQSGQSTGYGGAGGKGQGTTTRAFGETSGDLYAGGGGGAGKASNGAGGAGGGAAGRASAAANTGGGGGGNGAGGSGIVIIRNKR